MIASYLHWIYLAVAISCEVLATSALKSSEGFSRLTPSLMVIAGYGLSFYCLSLSLQTIPMGIAYAIWSGFGVILVSLAGWVFYNQHLDAASLIGIALIMAGVIVMNVFSSTLAV